MPARFEHGVEVEELAGYLEAYSARVVGALLHFLFLGCFNGDHLKIIQRRGRERLLNICQPHVAFCRGFTRGSRSGALSNEEYAEYFLQCCLNLLLTHKNPYFSPSYFCETDFLFKTK